MVDRRAGLRLSPTLAYACHVDFASMTDRVRILRADLAEIQFLNNLYLKQTFHDAREQQAHTRRRERLEQIVHELSVLKETGTSSMDRKFR
jgi:hypothetical protein